MPIQMLYKEFPFEILKKNTKLLPRRVKMRERGGVQAFIYG